MARLGVVLLPALWGGGDPPTHARPRSPGVPPTPQPGGGRVAGGERLWGGKRLWGGRAQLPRPAPPLGLRGPAEGTQGPPEPRRLLGSLPRPTATGGG